MRVSPRVEGALVLVPSAAELLTILSVASPLELAWHTASVGALLLRRRWPVAVLLAVLPAASFGCLLIAPMAALYQVAKDVRVPWAVAGGSVLIFLSALVPWWPGEDGRSSYEEALFGVLSAAMMSAGPTAVGRLVQARAQLYRRIEELARARDRERALLTEMAAAEERARLAREMHDVVSHRISLISVQAGAWEATTEDPESRAAAAVIRGLGAATLRELRQLLGALRFAQRPPGLGDLPSLIRSSGLPVRCLGEPVAALPWTEAVEHTAYRSVQEALTNIRKHAPGAEATVSLSRETPDGPVLVVDIHSTRPTAAATATAVRIPGGGHGLSGLRERAELLGGRLEAAPQKDGGFHVRVTLPEPRSAKTPATGPAEPQPPTT
ncbi:sensor histidine kinase [Streptomyces sp. NPDC057552]|uniref:sensor histidine kinase n=1 Tax=Streptomyces sp. NPDC057552 TaxID=3350537 RepID=UPI00368BCFD9